MERQRQNFKSIDEYIALFPDNIQSILSQLRGVIRKAAPDSEEKISYQMPTFFLKGNLVHFAAYKNHIGFYPTSSGVESFMEEITPYKHSKGAIRFPIDQPIPLDLVEKIVRFRVIENLQRARKTQKNA
ncbi:MAG: DUF1801 domain-containing protein [Chloroflexi bacterium]|nr:DUF1801 domain-containing protein [Chloroflexota bacterium]